MEQTLYSRIDKFHYSNDKTTSKNMIVTFNFKPWAVNPVKEKTELEETFEFKKVYLIFDVTKSSVE